MNTLPARFTHPHAELPARAHPTDAGLDLAASETTQVAPRVVTLAEGWTCDTHEPEQWGACSDCTTSHLRTARRALAAALPHLDAATPTRLAGTPEPLPCGCENPFNAIHLLDH